MKSKIRIIVPVLLGIVVFATTAFAYMYRKSASVDNTFVPAYVECAVNEEFADNTKTSVTVQNNGNTDAYIRVKIVSYWTDDEGNIMGIPSKAPVFTPASGWIPANGAYYYANKVPDGASTPSLLGSNIVLETSPEGYHQVVEIFAEAIQAQPAKAVQEAWGATVGTNGAITSVN